MNEREQRKPNKMYTDTNYYNYDSVVKHCLTNYQ